MAYKSKANSFFLKYIAALFVFLNCIFYRDFSYISFGGTLFIPEIFITEILLLISFFSLFLKIMISQRIRFDYQTRLWLIFFVYGCLLLFIDNNSSIFFKLREFASIAYSIFFFIMLTLLSDQKSSNLVFRAILLGSVFSIIYIFYKFIIGLGNYTTTEGVLRYGNYEFVGINILFCYSLSKLLSKPNNIILNSLLTFICFITVFVFIAHTSAMIAMLLSTAVILKIHYHNIRAKNITFVFFLISPILFIILFSMQDIPTVTFRFTRIFSNDIFNDPNVSWRLVTWLHALSQMELKDIVFGVGWGYELPVYFLNNVIYADDGYEGLHNSLLFYFFHTGIIGTILFVSLIIYIYKKAFIAFKIDQTSLINSRIAGLLGGNIGILIFSMFNVVLEGPYMAVIFWVSLGLLNNYGHNMQLTGYMFKK